MRRTGGRENKRGREQTGSTDRMTFTQCLAGQDSTCEKTGRETERRSEEEGVWGALHHNRGAQEVGQPWGDT